MKLVDIPVNTVVELQFEYLGEMQKVNSGILYKYSDTVYVSAIKSSGEIISAKKIKNFGLVYKTEVGDFPFMDLMPRSVSYCGQNLYAIQSDKEVQMVKLKKAARLLMGVPVSAKIKTEDKSRYINCVLKDISMVSMRLLSITKIEEADKVEISFLVNDKDVETLSGSIIYSYERQNGKGFLYEIEFDGPNEIIGRYVTKQLAEMGTEEDEGDISK